MNKSHNNKLLELVKSGNTLLDTMSKYREAKLNGSIIFNEDQIKRRNNMGYGEKGIDLSVEKLEKGYVVKRGYHRFAFSTKVQMIKYVNKLIEDMDREE